jgi:hypothetical protein
VNKKRFSGLILIKLDSNHIAHFSKSQQFPCFCKSQRLVCPLALPIAGWSVIQARPRKNLACQQ